MKIKTLMNMGISLLTLDAIAHAGSPSSEITEAQANTTQQTSTAHPDFLEKIKMNGDIRTRYEFREVDGLDASNALTIRARLGFTLGDFNGFSAFAEAEGTQGLIEDFRSNPTGSSSTSPYVKGNTPIADPNNIELNRAWVQYKKDGFLAKVGRQRIIHNNAAFIGNVGWRQNEQTFDAAQLSYQKDAYSINYAYSNRVQRIFGNDANDALPGPPLHDFEGEFHFLNGSYKTDIGTIGGYLYLIDVDNNSNVGESNTYGAFYKKEGLYVELAGQSGTSTRGGVGDYDDLYAHAIYSTTSAAGTFSAGIEYLGGDFKTPFATVHAFNGFADAFALNRIGLSDQGGLYDGLTDIYVGYSQKGLPGGLVLKTFAHYFMDDKLDEVYGYELDAVLIKAFRPNLKGILKASYFGAENNSGYSDIKQVSLGLNYSF